MALHNNPQPIINHILSKFSVKKMAQYLIVNDKNIVIHLADYIIFLVYAMLSKIHYFFIGTQSLKYGKYQDTYQYYIQI